MTYDQFIKTLQEKYSKYTLLIGIIPEEGKERWRYTERTLFDRFEQEWRSGGTSGASCWNDAPSDISVSPDDAPTTWEELDEVLETYWHDISYLQYRKFVLPLIRSCSRSESDYYGNSTNYSIHYVRMLDLFTVLKENGKLPA